MSILPLIRGDSTFPLDALPFALQDTPHFKTTYINKSYRPKTFSTTDLTLQHHFFTSYCIFYLLYYHILSVTKILDSSLMSSLQKLGEGHLLCFLGDCRPK